MALITRLFSQLEPLDAGRERLLDAAHAQFVDVGIRRTTIEDVARRAGVSRVTIYRHFADKNRLIEAVILREARRFFTELVRDALPLPTIDEQLAEGLVVLLRFARGHELYHRVLETEPEAILPHLTTAGAPLLHTARAFLAAQIRGAQASGLVPAELDADLVAELFVRMAHSFVLTPESAFAVDDEQELRRQLRRSAAILRAAVAEPVKPPKRAPRRKKR